MLYEIILPNTFERLNSVLDQPIKVSESDFLVAVFGRYGPSGQMTQRVFRFTFGSAVAAEEVPLEKHTTARGVLFAGDHGVWLMGFEDSEGNKDRLYLQQVGDYVPYKAPQDVVVPFHRHSGMVTVE